MGSSLARPRFLCPARRHPGRFLKQRGCVRSLCVIVRFAHNFFSIRNLGARLRKNPLIRWLLCDLSCGVLLRRPLAGETIKLLPTLLLNTEFPKEIFEFRGGPPLTAKFSLSDAVPSFSPNVNQRVRPAFPVRVLFREGLRASVLPPTAVYTYLPGSQQFPHPHVWKRPIEVGDSEVLRANCFFVAGGDDRSGSESHAPGSFRSFSWVRTMTPDAYRIASSAVQGPKRNQDFSIAPRQAVARRNLSISSPYFFTHSCDHQTGLVPSPGSVALRHHAS